eukprot:SAG11_NODE_1297_length_5269_cov_3.432302_6_plen_78_part_00
MVQWCRPTSSSAKPAPAERFPNPGASTLGADEAFAACHVSARPSTSTRRVLVCAHIFSSITLGRRCTRESFLSVSER